MQMVDQRAKPAGAVEVSTGFGCRICGNREGNRKHVAREMMMGLREEFEYIECASCGCLQVAEIPANLGKYYPAENYYSYQDSYAGFRGPLRNFLRRKRAAYAFGRRNPIGFILTRLFGEKEYHHWLKDGEVTFDSSILDVGCGGGELLLNLRSEGFKSLTGIDPYLPRPISYGKGLEIFNCQLSDLRDRQYDFIMLHHSFEHMPEPLAILGELRRLLKPGGRILIRVPLAGTWAWRNYGVNWVALDSPRHLYLHTPQSLRILARRAGLDVVRVEFDSTEFQFWGSEQYLRDIPLSDSRSYLRNPGNSPFTKRDIEAFQARANELNRAQDGDQAGFFLVHSGHPATGTSH